ncbi:hypothetical protein GLOTRDRAFT_139067 [Gloeophyllum trabeum ATCC 11539]|uniref:Transcription factor CBF/NF-Y/archaeal histone domain-containing protein n=1 Tax=Gloeophyllum trabeum (strain ATCC 11539 / FP-39264 / Madison 617) TaxID=670483 RepID=S7RJI5_GLOTA|nr:uncharacterized protein GLOTRDRAFT_139067 [Gloeophyllum trabeum ATCC 11539]EPQ54485.1 hypothetical protein GLOTRDRAFT_139067 [Gloeophyllum trabeum ATCC 11539]
MNGHPNGHPDAMRSLHPSIRLLGPSQVHLTLRPSQDNQQFYHHQYYQPRPRESEEEDDDEDVDQLDSDTDENEAADAMQVDRVQGASASLAGPGEPPVKKRRRSSVRKHGQSLLPQELLENILVADGSAGLNMSKEAMFVISMATEEFIKRLSREGQQRAAVDRRTTVDYRDMADCTHQRRQFSFLQDVIPQPMPLAAALQRRAAKADEVPEEEPSISTLSTMPPSASASATFPHSASVSIPHSASYTGAGTISIPPAQQDHTRQPSESARSARTSARSQVKLKIPRPPSASASAHNGGEKVNGKSEAAKLRKRDSRGRWSTVVDGSADAESASRARSGPAPAHVSPAQDSPTPEPHWAVLQAPHEASSSAEPPESFERGAPPPGISLSAGLGLGRAGWGVGPASGFLGGHGRTIYSTQRERTGSSGGSGR